MLGNLLRETKELTRANLSDLTVLSSSNDPHRLDTPANHVKGRWFREPMERCGLLTSGARIHNRGIHYAVVSLGDATLPGGGAYLNNADCWSFLEDASNIARWLGYVSWDQMIDARNAEPVIQIVKREELRYRIAVDADVYLPDADDFRPRIQAVSFDALQEYRLVFYGEKTSLGSVLQPLAERYGADLYLPAGEISNALLATMAKTGADEGRQMVVFIFADCDPAGYQMAVSIGHKLRALRDGLHPSLAFQVHAPALTVQQVRTRGCRQHR
ncbi:MAG: hypothetical protein AB7I34_15220 [Rhizobiaceae bacterium]